MLLNYLPVKFWRIQCNIYFSINCWMWLKCIRSNIWAKYVTVSHNYVYNSQCRILDVWLYNIIIIIVRFTGSTYSQVPYFLYLYICGLFPCKVGTHKLFSHSFGIGSLNFDRFHFVHACIGLQTKIERQNSPSSQTLPDLKHRCNIIAAAPLFSEESQWHLLLWYYFFHWYLFYPTMFSYY